LIYIQKQPVHQTWLSGGGTDHGPWVISGQKATIRVSRVLDVFTIYVVAHIVQESTDGLVLEDVWFPLSPGEQRCSMAQLKNCLVQFRAITSSHPERVQVVDGPGITDGRVESDVSGPFDNHAAFHQFLLAPTSSGPPEHYPRMQEALSRIYWKRYKTVFSYGNIGPHNLLWKDGYILVIDWGTSDWFPEYWDYNKLHAASDDMDGDGRCLRRRSIIAMMMGWNSHLEYVKGAAQIEGYKGNGLARLGYALYPHNCSLLFGTRFPTLRRLTAHYCKLMLMHVLL